jgi:hypothetical protein
VDFDDLPIQKIGFSIAKRGCLPEGKSGGKEMAYYVLLVGGLQHDFYFL